MYTGKRKWKKLSINDIEETIEGYQENWLEYTLIDANKFSKEKLLEDNLIISKAMLIEKSKNKEELYKNIEDIINIQKEKNTFDNLQLEKLIKYELSETKDKNIMNEFIEKIRNIEGGNEIMTNASRIINNEIRKQRREGKIEGIAEGRAEGKAEGIALMAKKLKGKMHIKDISQITGLSEEEINAKDHAYEVDPNSEVLVAYWKLNDGLDEIKDYSVNGNNATPSSTLTWVDVALPAKED